MISNRLFAFDNVFINEPLSVPSGKIYQITELSLIRGGVIEEHIQHCDEITYVVSGRATVYSGDTTFELTKGQVHFIKKGQYHKIIASENENFHFYCIGFLLDPEWRRPRCSSIRSGNLSTLWSMTRATSKSS